MTTATTVPTATGACLGKSVDPSEIELFPRHQRGPGPIEIVRAPANGDDLLVERTVDGHLPDETDRAVRNRQILRVAQETVDGSQCRTAGQKHRRLRQ